MRIDSLQCLKRHCAEAPRGRILCGARLGGDRRRLTAKDHSAVILSSERAIGFGSWCSLKPIRTSCLGNTRWASNLSKSESSRISKLRNVGILAHIDHGKTTLTERMLFYSGNVNSMGEVHDGDTVMDYMEQERERGITINSAATTLEWKSHVFNLVDTPGHVDFTVEVERSVRALDGAVALFDAVSGVQSQSETVWKQAARYNVPRIAFINKLDRVGADYGNVLQMLRDRFGIETLVTQLPRFTSDGKLEGIIDIIDMKLNVWDQENRFEKDFTSIPLSDVSKDELLHPTIGECWKARDVLIEQLCGFNDDFADDYLAAIEKVEEENDILKLISAQRIRDAIRDATTRQYDTMAVPILCGSALKNVGVQPLLDAIYQYLPNPEEAVSQTSLLKGVPTDAVPTRKNQGKKTTVGLVFKIQHDEKRGPLAFVRVYQGEMIPGVYFSMNDGKVEKERVSRLLRVYADRFEAVDRLGEGDIGILVGLKQTRTGDTISNVKSCTPLDGINIPQPVFTASIELESVSDESRLTEALAILTRDDPSLNFREDEELGQLLLSGMGELHLEVALERLRQDFKVPCEYSKVRVAYRETVFGSCDIVGSFRNQGNESDQAQVALSIFPHGDGFCRDTDLRIYLTDDVVGEGEPLLDSNVSFFSADGQQAGGKCTSWKLNTEQVHGLRAGITNSLENGPLLGYPVQGVVVGIMLSKCFATPSASPRTIRAAAAKAMQECMNQTNHSVLKPALLEPQAFVTISCPDDSIGTVIGDITNQRKGTILQVEAESCNLPGVKQTRSTITAEIPLEGLLGYASLLRSQTSGEGNFTLRVDSYSVVNSQDLERIKAEN